MPRPESRVPRAGFKPKADFKKPARSKPPKDEGETYVFGRNPVREALENGASGFSKIWLKEGSDERFAGEIRQMAKTQQIPVQIVPAEKLQRLVGDANHQGIVAQRAAVLFRDVYDLLRSVAPDLDAVRATKPVLMVLDQIEDPHNFGAILRSAAAAGVAGVIIPDRHMAPLSAVAIKASAGTALQIPIARVTNIADTLQVLKEFGYWVAGLDGNGDYTIWNMDWDRALALVIGNEGKGMRARVREACDFVVSIPMRGAVESLNASVATGIALFAAVRDR